MTKIIMGRLRLRLHTEERLAERLQNRCSIWFRAHLERALADVFMDYANTGKAPRVIDRLTVNVGDIPLSRFEAEMLERVLTQLKEQLTLRSLTRPVPGRQAPERATSAEPGLAAEPASVASTAPASETEAVSASPSARLFAHLLRYLDTGVAVDGHLWRSRQARDAWLHQALDGALPAAGPGGGTRPLPPRIALALRVLQPRARQRLVTTWSGQAISALASWLTPSLRLPSLAPSEAPGMVPLAALLALQRHPVSVPDLAAIMDRVSLSPPLPAVLRDGVPAPGVAKEDSDGEPSVTDWKRSGTFPVKSVVEQWFGALQQTALPASLRGPLHAWLSEPNLVREMAAILADVSVSVHRHLRAALGLSLPAQHKTVVPITPGANDQHRPVTDGEGGDARDHRSPAAGMPERPRSVAEAGTPDRPRAVTDAGEAIVRGARSFADEDDVPRSLTNAGLVLLWPLLPRLFSTFGWLEEGLFIDEQARGNAIGCLDWLAWGDPDLAQWRTPCTALLCGLDLDTPHEACLPSLSHQAELDAWLGGALATVPLLARCSVSDLRTFFLQRTGTFDNASRRLVIEPEAPDVLLHQLPWPLTPVVVPWLPAPLCVDWIS
ncbi:contractile injection system tape measure protein [Serratia marcescens]|uniref:contractile injection system tape measure protein n=1 Tax=Serratia marcescens TaxID=615 RepID=UPI003FA72291